MARYLAISLAVACGGSPSPTTPQPGSAVPVADAREAVRCGEGPALDGGKIGAWTLAGHTVTGTGTTIGVIADAGGAAPTTLAALGRLRAKLDAAHVDLVISLGGMGGTQAEIEGTLSALATSSWPVVAIPGYLEPDKAFDAALATLRNKVIDGRRARTIELAGATIGTLPGTGAPDRHAAGYDGCTWRPADLDALATSLGDKTGIRVIASFEAPRSSLHGDPTGDLPNASHSVDIVLAGAGEPSPAASGGRDGTAIALSPGTADATTRLAGPHTPSVGILAIHDGHWAWRTLADTP